MLQKEHNKILNKLLKESGRSKIVFGIVTLGDSNTKQLQLYYLHLELPTGNDVSKLTSRISKKTTQEFLME